MKAVEANFDGLVGPTHNYSGLSVGNIASKNNKSGASNPKQAVKQGLEKMKALYDMGFVQGVLAPQERPDIATLRRLGFSGSDANLLAACSSASSMWTANAATVSPSADTTDGKVHFTPANLINKFHRSIEDEVTGNILKATFADEKHFSHHEALPHSDYFGDEGAANHTRFCNEYGKQGVEFFVFAPKKYPARQTLEASEAIARTHGLREQFTVFAQQNPDVIDQGVFHNDVIAVGNKNTLFCHQQAFLNQEKVKSDLSASYGSGFNVIEVPTDEVSLQDAVETYLFNSQLITKPNGTTLIILPQHCRENPRVWAYLNELVEQKRGIDELHTFDLKQSMQNGGGPACLRLRVVLNQAEQKAVNQQTLMNDMLFSTLNAWADKHYRDRIEDKDLADPQLLLESRAALDELTQIMQLGSVYPFQK
ncbi:UNVERIFIED_CONTAM: hypothetical protein GTU68_035588 [Idotea baltica]|nr:hypothetical protein [Idotea baltica]